MPNYIKNITTCVAKMIQCIEFATVILKNTTLLTENNYNFIHNKL